jgi:uncharacterized protein YdeI (YjbR/CyaY-like superfamily)
MGLLDVSTGCYPVRCGCDHGLAGVVGLVWCQAISRPFRVGLHVHSFSGQTPLNNPSSASNCVYVYTMPINLPTLTVANATAWNQWLAKNHSKSTGIFVTCVKKGFTHPTTLTYPEALDEALCYGWIDSGGQRRKDIPNSQYFRFTPRKPKGLWSKRNVGFIERLETEGRMKPPGRAVVEAAKADGRWDAAYSGSGSAEPPKEFLDALEEVPEAKMAWEGLGKGERWAVYFTLINLKTQAGREKRIKGFVEMLARGEKPKKLGGKQTAKKTESTSLDDVEDGTKDATESKQSKAAPDPQQPVQERRTRSGRAVPSYAE